MQKLKLYVKETKRERRGLSDAEIVLWNMYDKYRSDEARAYFAKFGYIDHSIRADYMEDYTAEFETTTEREATTDEYVAFFEKQLSLFGVCACESQVWREKQLKDKEFRIEVVEE